MIYYKNYDYSILYDRPDLAFSPYIAALDIQFSHFVPYLWTFCIDSTGVVAYGRSFAELRDFLEILKGKLHLSADHILLIIVDDLFTFFGATKKELPYDPEPFVAKSHSDILLCAISECYQLHSYKAYFESTIEEDMPKIGIPEITFNHELLSPQCKLTQDEIDYSENRVYFISSIFRQELDIKYQGDPGDLPLTKTARVQRLISAELRRSSNKANCNLQNQIIKKNPITSEYGRNFILPQLYKAFFGGVTFFEENTIDKEYDNAYSADITSAYVARHVLSRFPVGSFEELPQPKSYKDLYEKPYNRYAMLITFEAHGLELRPGGFPFLPSEMRSRYIDTKNKEELLDRCEQISSTRLRSAKFYRGVLTDIDFKMMIENYTIQELSIQNILGASYGYLPDYIQNVIIRLYSGKAAAKQKKEALEKLGQLTPDVVEEYERIKSELARLYGIFTKRPIVERYVFDTALKEPKIIDEHYISPRSKYAPVLYQWGVWTTAHVRKEIADIRRLLLNAPKDRRVRVLSGDTDCVNFVGSANDIIAEYNEKIKRQIERRCELLGVDPEALSDLGSLNLKKYKKYKITGLKQYAYIQETESGDKFGYKVGGMDPSCPYFEKEFKTPEQRFQHFGLGLTIPAKYEPRKIKTCISQPSYEEWIDRDGNNCSAEILSYVKKIPKRFTLYPIMSPGPMANTIKADDKPLTLNELKSYARRIINPVYNPLVYINRRKENK